jgi:D-alanyl-D-alanine carboxypeptidase
MAGIAEVGEVGLGQPPSASAVLVHAVESPPLREILRDCMQVRDYRFCPGSPPHLFDWLSLLHLSPKCAYLVFCCCASVSGCDRCCSALLSQPSDNFLAENLLQLLAAHSDDTSAAPTAAAATTPAWDPVTPVTEGRQDGQASTAPAPMVGDVAKSLGVEPTQLRLVDGSGVSRQNLVTPRAVLQLLQAKRDDDEWHEFLTVRASCGAKKEKVA